MTTTLHDTGEEYILDVVMDGSVSRVTSVDVGLYNDDTDSLSEDDDVGDITTEPSGSDYERQSVDLDSDATNEDEDGDWQTTFSQQTFDVGDSSQEVDAYFVVVSFTSDDTDDSEDNDHLFFTGDLDQTYDLSQIDTFNLDDAGVSIS